MVNRRSALRSDYTLNCLIKVFIERHLLAHFPVIYCICVTSHVYMLSACSKATTALSIDTYNKFNIVANEVLIIFLSFEWRRIRKKLSLNFQNYSSVTRLATHLVKNQKVLAMRILTKLISSFINDQVLMTQRFPQVVGN